ncbi:MAG: UDP-N-acetylmuramate--L-alanine ligase [Proteobacteria bacterium]|nr:MAG: UDP-N-acetylmuramate--L-alanine ligase [Pseudomonadota bacterium]
MSGISEILHRQGYPISGSDIADSDTTRKLRSLGIRVDIGHDAKNLGHPKVVVISTAVKLDNPELREAVHLRIPVIRRAEMLGEIMRGKTGIAVAGTHGKTTTTSMMASVLVQAELSPTIVIGGKVDALGGANAVLGDGEIVLAEADESDGSFIHLPATYAIITNIDADHLDHFANLDAIDEAFIGFVRQIPFYGTTVVCGDDLGVQRCMPKFAKPFLIYGTNASFDYYLKDLQQVPGKTEFDVYQRGGVKLGRVQLPAQGDHNAMNALAVVALSHAMGVEFSKIVEGLKKFSGVKRRFETRYERADKSVRVIDDYGHHPTEVSATLAAARKFWGDKRIVVVFQPHRYSRTLHCEAGFIECFKDADTVFLTDIYAASEDPIPGVHSKVLASKIETSFQAPKETFYSGSLPDTLIQVSAYVQEGDLILTLGAGSITHLAPDIGKALDARWNS